MEEIVLTEANIPEIGNILTQIRYRKDVSQDEVRRKMEVPASQISNMEHNNKIPNLITVAKYLQCLGGGCRLVILLD